MFIYISHPRPAARIGCPQDIVAARTTLAEFLQDVFPADENPHCAPLRLSHEDTNSKCCQVVTRGGATRISARPATPQLLCYNC
jgi:hypothetical protein